MDEKVDLFRKQFTKVSKESEFSYSGQNMDAVCFSEKSIYLYKNERCHIQADERERERQREGQISPH